MRRQVTGGGGSTTTPVSSVANMLSFAGFVS
jgi:hypothetical protein